MLHLINLTAISFILKKSGGMTGQKDETQFPIQKVLCGFLL